MIISHTYMYYICIYTYIHVVSCTQLEVAKKHSPPVMLLIGHVNMLKPAAASLEVGRDT